jgi:ribonuclease-3 family protein
MKQYQLLNGSNLAYIGDAYYELKVREYLINKGITKANDLRKISIKYVSASAHQKIYEEIKDLLTEEESKVFLRGRNNAPSGYRKNVDRAAYLVSTGLEAVIGYLYLSKNEERLEYLINLIFSKVDGE